MAYELNKYNGTFFVSVDDQTLNTTATDLRFVGRNYSGYGEIENENFLHLLENFANTSAPPKAINGQLWFDTSIKKLKVFDGTKFKIASSAESSATAPTGLAIGDFWWDNQNEQIKVWNGTEFILVGPEKAPIYGLTSTAPAVVKDIVGSDQQVIKFQVGGDVVAIVANRAFTLNSIINPITGFSEIKQGINFINSNSAGVTSSAHRFWGTAANADRLGGYTSDDFLRSGNTTFTTQVNFKDNGFTIGDSQDLKITVANGTVPVIESTKNSLFVLRISDDGNDVKDVAVIKRTGIEPGITGMYDLGSTAAKWKTVISEEVKATTFYGKLIGTVETAPGPGGVVPPLAIQSVAVSGSFSMAAPAPGSPVANFNVSLAGSTSAVNLSSGSTGSLDNFNIGGTNPGSAKFTTIASSGAVAFTNTATSTGPGTGALVVAGGASIGGNLYVSGNGGFLGTGGMLVPSGVSGQRPAAAAGMIRFNTTEINWEGYDGSSWRSISGGTDEDYGLITSVADSFMDYGSIA
jgi:hypothetical protein